jgi:hypothetical protein
MGILSWGGVLLGGFIDNIIDITVYQRGEGENSLLILLFY